MTDIKKWYLSRQLWVAAIVIAVGVFSGITGKDITASDSEVILGFVMVILRLVTSTPVSLVSEPTPEAPV